jgi:hypothetical protein
MPLWQRRQVAEKRLCSPAAASGTMERAMREAGALTERLHRL